MDLYYYSICIPTGASDFSLVRLVQIFLGSTQLLIKWARETHFLAGYCCWDPNLTSHFLLAPRSRMSGAMSHSTHTPECHAQRQLPFHSYTAVASKCRRPCNCYFYWRQEILFARLQLSGDVCPAALVGIWIRVQIPAISGLVLDLCVTSLHNYKFEDWGFIILVLMFCRGSVRLALSQDTPKNMCVVYALRYCKTKRFL